jgi:hypothetical protein
VSSWIAAWPPTSASAPGTPWTAVRSALIASYAGWLSYDAVSWALITVRPLMGATVSESGRQPFGPTCGPLPPDAPAFTAAASLA